MKVALICCGRLENRYAIEYVEHYKKLGFDHIYIADNNHDGEEYFEDVLQSYIDDNFVTIYDFRNKEVYQIKTYEYIYNIIKDDYDWVAFFDFDEFLTLVEDNNIKDYLSRDCFKNYKQIVINWRMYTDNNLLLDDGRPCLERFTKSYDFCHQLPYFVNYNKPIMAGRLNGVFFNILSYFDKWWDNFDSLVVNYTCNSIGETISYGDQIKIPINYTLSYLKHFTTKTLDEYINNKCVKGVGDRTYECFKNTYSLINFFKINDFTEEKIEYLKTKLNYTDKDIERLKRLINIVNQ